MYRSVPMRFLKASAAVFLLMSSAAVAQPYGAAMSQSAVSCAATATQVLLPELNHAYREVYNTSGVTVFLGPAGVTAATGRPIAAASGFDLSKLTGPLFCIVASGTATVIATQY
jgi:hypothetical protein